MEAVFFLHQGRTESELEMNVVKKEQLVINTVVFLNELNKGVDQSNLMDHLYKHGFKNIEIRREFIKNFGQELQEIKQKATLYGMQIYYSVPEWLFKENKLCVNELEKYFQEAMRMDCHRIKMIIGEFSELQKQDVDKIHELTQKYDIHLTVENDQSLENGRMDKIYKFLSQSRKNNGDISFTFDTGNWIFQKEDPLENAKILKSFVTYIHLKDIDDQNNTTLLNKGRIPWKEVLGILPNNIPIGLEYPCATMADLEEEIHKIVG